LGLPHALTGALLLSTALGCATLDKLTRKPGERLEAFPEAVWEEYGCDERKRPFLEIERYEISPKRLKPGDEFAHQLVYALCPRRVTEVVTGRLTMRIRYKGKPIVHDTDTGFELKPGRWVVDSFVGLAPTAEPGIYAYEIEFESADLNFDHLQTFMVGAP
jgi:hypothetical protein